MMMTPGQALRDMQAALIASEDARTDEQISAAQVALDYAADSLSMYYTPLQWDRVQDYAAAQRMSGEDFAALTLAQVDAIANGSAL